MARCIDADKLCEALKSMASVQYPDKQNTILGVVSSIENFPTADVVPKSEWNRIYTELEGLKSSTLPRLRLDLQMANTKVAEADMAKAEVAREIFEEIEKAYERSFWIDNDNIGHFQRFKLDQYLAELKKIYAEEKE